MSNHPIQGPQSGLAWRSGVLGALGWGTLGLVMSILAMAAMEIDPRHVAVSAAPALACVSVLASAGWVARAIRPYCSPVIPLVIIVATSLSVWQVAISAGGVWPLGGRRADESPSVATFLTIPAVPILTAAALTRIRLWRHSQSA